MGKRKVTIKQSAADSIARIAWYIESQGLVATAEKFSDSVYDFFEHLSDDRRTFPACREPQRAALGYKCTSFRKKYTVVFIETDTQLIICEFISSKLIKW